MAGPAPVETGPRSAESPAWCPRVDRPRRPRASPPYRLLDRLTYDADAERVRYRYVVVPVSAKIRLVLRSGFNAGP